jgi:hypothetical protein
VCIVLLSHAQAAAAFLELDSELELGAEADAAVEDALAHSLDSIAVFLETSLTVEPHLDADFHLASLELSPVDLAELDVEAHTADVDALLARSERLTDESLTSFLDTAAETEAEAEVEAEAEEEVEAEAEAEVEEETEVDAEAETETESEETALLDAEASVKAETDKTFRDIAAAEEVRLRTGHETEASLIAAAEAEMAHDMAAAERDVLDLSDLEEIDA